MKAKSNSASVAWWLLLALVVVASLALVAAETDEERDEREQEAHRVGTAASFLNCTVCGDPHWHTFDGVRHDFQGAGVYVQVNSPQLIVQSQHSLCRPEHNITCLRSSTVQLRTPAVDYLYVNVKYGAWRVNKTVVYDSLLINDRVVDPNICVTLGACRLPFELGNVTFSKKVITVNSFLTGATIVIGAFHLVVRLPFNNFNGVTDGLCGLLDGDASNDFTANSTLYLKSERGKRYNGPKVKAWAANYAVDGVNILPLSKRFMLDTVSGREIELLDTVPTITIPTDDDTAAIQNVQFTDMDALNRAQAQCRAVDPTAGPNDLATLNCVYDSKYMGDQFELAASNHLAQINLRALDTSNGSSSSSSLSTDAIVGISVGIGLTAILAVVIAVVLHKRVNAMTEKYRNALIVRPQNSPTAANSMNLANNL